MVNTKEIKKRMVDCDLTTAELADEVGMSPTYVGAVINGKKPLTLNTAERIQSVLGISNDDFGRYFLSGEKKGECNDREQVEPAAAVR